MILGSAVLRYMAGSGLVILAWALSMAAAEVTRARAAVAIVDRVAFTLDDGVDWTAKRHLAAQMYLSVTCAVVVCCAVSVGVSGDRARYLMPTECGNLHHAPSSI